MPSFFFTKKSNKTALQHSNPSNITRTLLANQMATTVWGDESDIKYVLGNMLHETPESMQTNNAYILPSVSLDPSKYASAIEKEQPHTFLQYKVADIIAMHPDKKMTLIIPVNSMQSHWRLVKVVIDQGVLKSAMLWDSMSSNITRSKSFDVFKKAITAINPHATIGAQAVGLQKNGYSCLDYVMQESLRSLPASSLTKPLAAIASAPTGTRLREAVVEAISDHHPQLIERKRQAALNLTNTDKLASELVTKPELQVQFDEMMAKELSRLYQANSSENEAILVDKARQFALNSFQNRLGMFAQQTATADGKPTAQTKKTYSR